MLPSPHLKLTHLSEKLKNKLITDINEFRTTFGLPVGAETFSESDDELHTSLWVEELIELGEANDLAEKIDSLVDQVYVLTGRISQHGAWSPEIAYIVDVLVKICVEKYNVDFVKAWDEIHGSNLSKTCSTQDQVDDNIKFYADKGVKLNVVKIGERYVLKCAEECVYKETVVKVGKVMKSIFYREADLTGLLPQ